MTPPAVCYRRGPISGGDITPVVECERSAVGGDVRAPRRISGSLPDYATALRENRKRGAVVLFGRIHVEGLGSDWHVVSSADPGLSAAAMEAVSSWKWTPPRLDCMPVDASVTLTVEFRLQP